MPKPQGPMMERDAPAEGPLIKGISAQGFRVGDRIVPGGLVMTPTDASDWDAPAIDALTLVDLASIVEIDPAPEFLLLGTGATMRRPSPAFIKALEARGIGVEPMDSRAAARAWGVLRGEGRWIVAALMPL